MTIPPAFFMPNLLNLEAIKAASMHQQPYPFFVVNQSIYEHALQSVVNDFPAIEQGGSFTLQDVQSGPAFEAFVGELDTADFRALLSKKLDMDLNSLPMVITLRGISRAKDGRVHTDSISKVATILIYFNEHWSAETGQLRVLNSHNMDDTYLQIKPSAGSLLAFKVCDNCWHGYPSYEGVRRSIQINFVADEKAIKKHHNRHAFTAKIKKLVKAFVKYSWV